MELGLADDQPDEMTAYERLLGDAMAGENLLFAREDGVEAAWRVVNPRNKHASWALPWKSGRGRCHIQLTAADMPSFAFVWRSTAMIRQLQSNYSLSPANG